MSDEELTLFYGFQVGVDYLLFNIIIKNDKFFKTTNSKLKIRIQGLKF